MARNRKPSDDVRNARRREYRAAQRYLKKAEETSGATAARNRALAKTHLFNALETYDPAQNQKLAAPIVNVAAQLGIDIQKSRSEFITSTQEQRQQAVERSYSALEENLKDPSKRKAIETQALLRNKAIGRRIMGGLVDVWRDSAKKDVSARENRQNIQKAIFDYFKVDSWSEVFERLVEAVGSALFNTEIDQEIYDVVRITLQTKINNNTLVA